MICRKIFRLYNNSKTLIFAKNKTAQNIKGYDVSSEQRLVMNIALEANSKFTAEKNPSSIIFDNNFILLSLLPTLLNNNTKFSKLPKKVTPCFVCTFFVFGDEATPKNIERQNNASSMYLLLFVISYSGASVKPSVSVPSPSPSPSPYKYIIIPTACPILAIVKIIFFFCFA